MKNTIQNNLSLLDKLYSFTFNELNRSVVFDCVNKYKAHPTTENLKLALAIILKWGAYYESTGRKNNITEIELVKQYITDDYAIKFHELFVSRIEILTPKELYMLFKDNNPLKIMHIRHAYFTKILYFFSPRDKGLLILDKWLVLNSMKLAIDYQDEYAIKWYSKITPHGYIDDYNYAGVSADSYQDYINFMQRMKTKFNIDYADQLETLLFGWRKSLQKPFAGYANPRYLKFGDTSFIPASQDRTSPKVLKSAHIISVNLDISDFELLKSFITMKPKGTMEFACQRGHEKGSNEYIKVYTTMNKILRSMQNNSASCKIFFNETLPSISINPDKSNDPHVEYITQLQYSS